MKLNALIVDDSRTARAIIIKTLRLTSLEWGEMHEAAHGGEALEKLASAWVDVIFTDLHMPEMDGFELVSHLCGDELLRTIPIIVTSTEGNRERIDALHNQGVRAYLRKPFTAEQACEVIMEVLEKKDA